MVATDHVGWSRLIMRLIATDQAHVAWLRAQPLGQSVSLKFSLKTRLESESFQPLIDAVMI